jgi:hypothetical protein
VKLHLSYSSLKTSITIQGEVIQVKPYQVIVWISVATKDVLVWDPKIPKIPAILDTGNNHNLSIQAEHLVKWGGIEPEALPLQGKVREKGEEIPLRAAAFWLHTDMGPFALNMDDGVAVYARNGPRLPLFGLRALTNNKLQAMIHGDKKEAIIRTPPSWYWPF